MTRRCRPTLQALWFLGAALVHVSALPAQETSLIPFELEDQFDRTYRGVDYADRIVIVLGSDREGTEFNQPWGEALNELVEAQNATERVTFLPVADLQGVPFFIKGMVRRRFPKEPDRWALMDWDGDFDEAYGFTPEATNVLLFAPDGRLVEHIHGREVEEALLELIAAPLRALLEDAGSSGAPDAPAHRMPRR